MFGFSYCFILFFDTRVARVKGIILEFLSEVYDAIQFKLIIEVFIVDFFIVRDVAIAGGIVLVNSNVHLIRSFVKLDGLVEIVSLYFLVLLDLVVLDDLVVPVGIDHRIEYEQRVDVFYIVWDTP